MVYQDTYLRYICLCPFGWKENTQIAVDSPVLESMRAREPGLQAPNNLTGSKIKYTHFFPLSILSQRNDIQYWEKYLYHVRCSSKYWISYLWERINRGLKCGCFRSWSLRGCLEPASQARGLAWIIQQRCSSSTMVYNGGPFLREPRTYVKKCTNIREGVNKENGIF